MKYILLEQKTDSTRKEKNCKGLHLKFQYGKVA